MTQRNFIRSLRRGLGSAIVELTNNPDKEGKYRDAVMRACLTDIAHDTQAEGTKGHYLYMAIKTFENPDEFVVKMAEKFGTQLKWRLWQQVLDTLDAFSEDGSLIADNALAQKYAQLLEYLPTIIDCNDPFGERGLIEQLMIRKLRKGFDAFKSCINDIGGMIKAHGNDDCVHYDWFIDNAVDTYEEQVLAYIEGAETENVAIFRTWYKRRQEHYQSLRYEDEKVTIERLVARANELAAQKSAYPFSMTWLARDFAKAASDSELARLTDIAFAGQSSFVQVALLCAFRYVDFPYNIEPLILLALSGDECQCRVAVEALSRFEDKRLRGLANQLFEVGKTEDALKLLETNFAAEDESLIRKYVKSTRKITFSIIGSIRIIFDKHRSKTCGDILGHCYQNAECTHCRYAVVVAMVKNNVITPSILNECRFDSYEDTRKLAEDLL